ncbi:MAG: nucleotidyl transferase AbiEii/AbiGii toxin family protein [Patescibacteria group bacterium]
MAKTILTPLQQKALDWVANQPLLTKQFYLSGGTALAEFYLHHRVSEDLDFFSVDEFDPSMIGPIAEQLKQHVGAKTLQLEQRFNRNIIYLDLGAEMLKVEFSWFIGTPIDESNHYHALRIDSARDIAVNKLFTIYQRPRSRDYIDLYLLMTERGYGLQELIDLARNKFDWHVDPLQLAGRFLEIDLADWPMLIHPIDEMMVRKFFNNLARELEPAVLSEGPEDE